MLYTVFVIIYVHIRSNSLGLSNPEKIATEMVAEILLQMNHHYAVLYIVK